MEKLNEEGRFMHRRELILSDFHPPALIFYSFVLLPCPIIAPAYFQYNPAAPTTVSRGDNVIASFLQLARHTPQP